MKSLLKNTKQIRVSNAVAAGTSAINSTGVPTADAEGVKFDVHFGAIVSGAVTSVKLQQSSDDGSTDDYTDIAGSSCTVADDQDNKILTIELYNPQKNYVRAVVTRGTQNATVDSIVATLFKLRKAPPTQDASIIATSKVLAGAAEGTA